MDYNTDIARIDCESVITDERVGERKCKRFLSLAKHPTNSQSLVAMQRSLWDLARQRIRTGEGEAGPCHDITVPNATPTHGTWFFLSCRCMGIVGRQLF